MHTLFTAHISWPPTIAVEAEVETVDPTAACERLNTGYAALHKAQQPILNPDASQMQAANVALWTDLCIALEIVSGARPPVNQHDCRPRLAKHIIGLRFTGS